VGAFRRALTQGCWPKILPRPQQNWVSRIKRHCIAFLSRELARSFLPAHGTKDDASEKTQQNFEEPLSNLLASLRRTGRSSSRCSCDPSKWEAQGRIEVLHVPELDAGFHLLYELKPAEARAQFEVWQKSHPEDPLARALEAAAYLIEECYQQGVLTSEFFLDNQRFSGQSRSHIRNCAQHSSSRTNRRRTWRSCD
jgi:hypothetical protein